MYKVMQSGHSKGEFKFFFDAWLHVILEEEASCTITGPDGVWKMEPPHQN